MQKQRLTIYLLDFLAVIGLGVYAYIGNFTRMLADDFCSLYFADRLGLLRSTWYWYLNWSGRYAAFAADWAVLKAFLGPYHLHYVVPATLFLWLTSAILALHLYFRSKGKFALPHAVTLGSIFLFIVLLLSPNIPQSLFWWNGMRSYAIPLVLLTFQILLFQASKASLDVNPVIANSFAFTLFFINGGMGETFAVAQTAFLLFLIGLQVLKLLDLSKKDLTILYSGLGGAVLSLVVVILSPGNAIRQALLPPSPDLVTLISISVQSYRIFLSEFFLEPAKIMGLLGAILAVLWIGGQHSDLVPVKTWLIPAYVLGGLAISFVCFPPGVFGYSEPPPTRTMIIPVFFLAGGILCAGFLTGGWLVNRRGPAWLTSNVVLLSTLLLVGISATSTFWSLYKERDTYIGFAVKWDQVDAQILQAKADGLGVVNIPAMDNWAGLERPTDNKKYWPTICYSSYYGIQVFGPPIR